MRRGIPRFIIGCSMLALAGAPVANVAKADPPSRASAPLEMLLPQAEKLQQPTFPGVIRTRGVEVDPSTIARLGVGQSVRLALFEDIAVTFDIERLERRAGTEIWAGGLLTGEHAGSVSLVYRQATLFAEVRTAAHGLYRVRGSSDKQRVDQLDDTTLPDCATGAAEAVGGPAPQGGVAGDGFCDDGTVIDVVAFYTPIARDSAGGVGPIEGDIALAFQAANDAYANSGLDLQVNLLSMGVINYDESGSYSTHLNRITNKDDGFMDEAHDIRDDLGADLVALFVDDNQYCGIAWLMTNPWAGFESNGFSVTTWFCSSLVMAHEFGHNMGCQHDHDNAGSSPAFPDSFGHRFNGNSGTLWRTVMSYSPGTRIPNFSNPDVLVDSQPTGVPLGQPDPANNASTLDQTRTVVANFRCSTATPENLLDYTSIEEFEAALIDPTTVHFDGVPSGLILYRDPGYSWDGLGAGVALQQVDSNVGGFAGAPYLSDFVAATDPNVGIVLEMPADLDAIGARWFHSGDSAGIDGAFRITYDDGTASSYVIQDLSIGANQTLPDFVGFVSQCNKISSVEFIAGTPLQTTLAMADQVVFGDSGYGCPDNDDCGNAIAVGYGATEFITINASTDGPVETACTTPDDNRINADVWYRFDAECDGEISVSVCDADFNTRLAVYGPFCPLGINSAIACNDDSCGDGSSVTFMADGGLSYHIRIGGPIGQTGIGNLSISGPECIPAPLNNDCGNSMTIGEGTVAFTTIGATTDGPSEPDCNFDGANQIDHDVWFRFLATCDDVHTVTVCDADFEPRVAIYDVNCPDGPGQRIDCNAGAC
ncbi:MAG: M12 family metallo-peptidase, partial [Planctomycetota bacterium]